MITPDDACKRIEKCLSNFDALHRYFTRDWIRKELNRVTRDNTVYVHKLHPVARVALLFPDASRGLLLGPLDANIKLLRKAGVKKLHTKLKSLIRTFHETVSEIWLACHFERRNAHVTEFDPVAGESRADFAFEFAGTKGLVEVTSLQPAKPSSNYISYDEFVEMLGAALGHPMSPLYTRLPYRVEVEHPSYGWMARREAYRLVEECVSELRALGKHATVKTKRLPVKHPQVKIVVTRDECTGNAVLVTGSSELKGVDDPLHQALKKMRKKSKQLPQSGLNIFAVDISRMPREAYLTLLMGREFFDLPPLSAFKLSAHIACIVLYVVNITSKELERVRIFTNPRITQLQSTT